MRVLSVVLLVATSLAGCADSGSTAMDPEPSLPGGQSSLVAEGAYSVFPGNFTIGDVSSRTLVTGTLDVLPVASVVLESTLDGVDIDMSMWLPGTDDPVPAIIQASPYFPRTDVPSGSQRFGEWIVEEFVPHGYAYVQLAIRSTASSGGCDDFRGPHMTADMDQAIDWLAQQDWSNGNVSLIGKSYPGSTPWYAGGSGNPHIKTIVPTSGSTNAWEVYNRNGTPESRAAAIVPNYGISAISNTDRSPEHKVENFACVEVYQAWANGVVSGATGERITDDWWDERNSKPSVEANYKGSILLVHGLEDWNVDPAVAIPWTQELADAGLEVKQLLGQWAHDWPDQGSDDTIRWDWAEILLRWFDRELKGRDVDVGPPVQVQSNDGLWRDELAWPPKDAVNVDLYPLDGAFVTDKPPGNGMQRMTGGTVPDVAPATLGPAPRDTVSFSTQPLNQSMRIAGLPEVHFTVTPDGPGGYMGATLYAEDPSGQRTRIGWTGMNFRYHAGGEEPQNVVPGEPITLKAQVQPMDAYVEQGHRIVLVVGALTPSDRIAPPHPYSYTLHAGSDSVLRLPVVERGDAAFFEPPA